MESEGRKSFNLEGIISALLGTVFAFTNKGCRDVLLGSTGETGNKRSPSLRGPGFISALFRAIFPSTATGILKILSTLGADSGFISDRSRTRLYRPGFNGEHKRTCARACLSGFLSGIKKCFSANRAIVVPVEDPPLSNVGSLEFIRAIPGTRFLWSVRSIREKTSTLRAGFCNQFFHLGVLSATD